MAKKMRIFKFWNPTGLEEETEQMSLKKAVKAIQTKFEKDKFIGVEYLTKKGKEMATTIKLPWGRKKKLGR